VGGGDHDLGLVGGELEGAADVGVAAVDVVAASRGPAMVTATVSPSTTRSMEVSTVVPCRSVMSSSLREKGWAHVTRAGAPGPAGTVPGATGDR
jgi:hypothetical protein